MKCCCHQNAVSVPEVHAPFETSALHVLTPVQSSTRQIVRLSELDCLPYQNTKDHLSRLSVLRL